MWGDDLRELGIVVEPMHGADELVAAVADFRPGPTRRLAVILDHLVAGSKESRLAAGVADRHVLITGHPFVDVWAGIRPRVLGIERWPDVPKGRPWKQGMCAALGVELDNFWPRLRNRVSTYADLEPELVGAVERADRLRRDRPRRGESPAIPAIAFRDSPAFSQIRWHRLFAVRPPTSSFRGMAQTITPPPAKRGPVTGTAGKRARRRKPFLLDLYSTAVGKKYVMAITGHHRHRVRRRRT